MFAWIKNLFQRSVIIPVDYFTAEWINEKKDLVGMATYLVTYDPIHHTASLKMEGYNPKDHQLYLKKVLPFYYGLQKTLCFHTPQEIVDALERSVKKQTSGIMAAPTAGESESTPNQAYRELLTAALTQSEALEFFEHSAVLRDLISQVAESES